ncbi:bis(5'-nucleosyl)-tetraphosphatase [Legionella beliardensis]|uniref:Bis(5'-nucleosyl)-tetraphosphatase, symmetrical n=1 Tax=Legionella beliardensis TaxID=91822 RepID=A0A378I4W4_9GAMM|nr:symmetrical bis(5'-nucleosyl)-tetraphosphatase [Legionella beliardensis]STX27544.1 bis(5'-nucleosyl)-tetraphosphatase [Legionella beliardensis]
MADYVVGDIQGCYEPLLRLLDSLHFNEREDRLWLVGDLVNRGPQSLEVLRFVKNLPIEPYITLGNHDLHLLNRLFGQAERKNKDDTLQPILLADDRDELGHWLRKQRFLYYDSNFNIVMTHAGIAPVWDLETAKACAKELEAVLHGENYQEYLSNMYGNLPNQWSLELTGFARWRIITNYLTRMRFCGNQGELLLDYKGTIKQAPPDFIPWFSVPKRKEIDADIIFGHWAALQGKCPHPRIYALDTGCLWGGRLTALRLQDKQCFSVPGLINN